MEFPAVLTVMPQEDNGPMSLYYLRIMYSLCKMRSLMLLLYKYSDFTL